MKKLSLHWRLHPDKDDEWYSDQKERMTQDEVARELDINYNLSASGTVFAKEFKPELHTFSKPYTVNKNARVIRVVDYGRVNAALFMQLDTQGVLTTFKELVLDKSNTPDQAKTVAAYSASLECQGFDDYGDPAGNNPDHRSTTTDYDIMAEYRIYPCSPISERIPDRRKQGIQLIKKKLSELIQGTPVLQISQAGCPTLIEAFMSGYRYKTDRAGQIVHNDAIHEEHPWEDVMDCFRYGVVETLDVENRYQQRIPRRRKKTVNKYLGR